MTLTDRITRTFIAAYKADNIDKMNAMVRRMMKAKTIDAMQARAELEDALSIELAAERKARNARFRADDYSYAATITHTPRGDFLHEGNLDEVDGMTAAFLLGRR